MEATKNALFNILHDTARWRSAPRSFSLQGGGEMSTTVAAAGGFRSAAPTTVLPVIGIDGGGDGERAL